MDWFRQLDWAGLLPFLFVLASSLLLLLAVNWLLLRRWKASVTAWRFRHQAVMLLLTALAAVALLLVLPVSDATRGQLLRLLGLLLSAVIAFSSTSFVANAMAGLMLRAVRSFRLGDFIRAGDQFGRVSELGLFHTEIQTEDRDLSTLPNLFLVNQPVTVVRSSGTILSTVVSLGYDVPRQRIESALLGAAAAAELEDPFVQIVELGSFAVGYRIAGLLVDVKGLISARARLRACVLDALHGAGIEIVSPTFMNQRVLADGRRFVPPPAAPASEQAEASPEAIIFDKAEDASAAAEAEAELLALGPRIQELERGLGGAPEPERSALERELGQLRARRQQLERALARPREGRE
jgi:small-conductance mechanosensitive channel